MERIVSFLTALFLSLFAVQHADAQVYGVVTFNMRGVDGYIEFRPMQNGSMRIIANLRGFTMRHGWHVHELPVDTSLPPQQRCSNDFVGGHFDPFGAADDPDYGAYCSPTNQTACEVGDLSGKLGILEPNTSGIDDTGELTLYGTYGIIGRAIKIHGMEDVCGTILSSSEARDGRSFTLLKASFVYPFGGTIYFRQVEGESTVIFGKVFWTTLANNTMGHNWHVHANLPGSAYREGDCSRVGGHYNPFNVNITAPSYSTSCNAANLNNCEVGDLSNKHGRINVLNTTTTYSREAFFFHDSFLNLTGMNPVIDRSIAIHSVETGAVQGCAPLVRVESLSLMTGDKEFSFAQSSRFDPTTINAHMMRDDSSYRILSSAFAPNQFCIDAFKAGRSQIYNPHDAPSLDGTNETPDRYPVGNLSAKHRNIAGGGNFDELPIHGIETIAGHSFGLSYTANDATSYTCRTLKPVYPEGSEVRMAKAVFNDTIKGAIYFTQRDFGSGVYGNTYVVVDIWYSDSSRTRTTGHNWHIHENPPTPGQTCGDSIGGHFNPFNADVTLASGYSSACSIYSPLRCESGDLSGKHGVLNIDPPSANRESVTYTDSNLHLFGPSEYSIIGRSVGLHLPANQGGSLFSCGEIFQVFEASDVLSFRLPYSQNFNRVEFAMNVTRNIDGATPDDVLMTGQSMSSRMSDYVNVNLTVLGTTRTEADDKLRSVQSELNEMYGDSSAVIIPSFILLLGLLVINYMLI